MSNQTHLPATYRSLYRLFLRTSSAAVLHQWPAKRNLISRWRPMFDAGLKVVRELQVIPSDTRESRRRIAWLNLWNERMDGTLQFLYNASQSRGLPHQVSRNLGFLYGNERRRGIRTIYTMPKWKSGKVNMPKESKKKDDEIFYSNNADGALHEIIRLAEGTSNLTLGRHEVVIRRWPKKITGIKSW